MGAGLRGQKKGKRPPATKWGKLFVKSSSVFAGLFQYIYFCVGVGGRWGPWRGVENALLRNDWNRWTLRKINTKILLLLDTHVMIMIIILIQQNSIESWWRWWGWWWYWCWWIGDNDDEFISFASLKLAPSGFEQSLKFCFAPQNHNNYLHSIWWGSDHHHRYYHHYHHHHLKKYR